MVLAYARVRSRISSADSISPWRFGAAAARSWFQPVVAFNEPAGQRRCTCFKASALLTAGAIPVPAAVWLPPETPGAFDLARVRFG